MDRQLLAARKSLRHKLVDIYHALDQFGPSLLPADLKQVGIQQLPMTLEEGDGPQFFAQYTSVIEPPERSDSEGDIWLDQEPYYNARSLAFLVNEFFCHCILPNEEAFPPGVQYSDWGNFGFGDLVDMTRGSRWQLKSAYHMPKSGAPHIVALMFNEMASAKEAALFHGEIKTAIRIMHRRLNTSVLRPNVIAPVLLFSAIGEHHLRVIEAYHDSEQLVMRTTPLFDLSKPDDSFLIKLTRWCLGGASSKSTKL
ncbi:hypothetical protein BDW69DRAFT_177536 [Aspergillus filifer]